MAAGDDLGSIASRLAELQRAQESLEASTSRVAETLDATVAELREFRDRFEGFLERDELAGNLLNAQVQIVSVRQDLARRFGHYDEIRRLANGILLAMDAGTVTHESIQHVSEQKMLTAPGYWLAPALVGLAAWIRNDRILTERALSTAVWRDNDKTALFYALVLARQNRDVAAAKWLSQAVGAQDPRALPREFAVMLDAAVSDVLGPAARPFAVEHMTSWFERLKGDSDAVADQINRWHDFLMGMRRSVEGQFAVLPEISPTWPLLADLYEEVDTFDAAENHFRTLRDKHGTSRTDLQHQVDEILKNLVFSNSTTKESEVSSQTGDAPADRPGRRGQDSRCPSTNIGTGAR